MTRGVSLFEHQEEAVAKMKNGCILCGGVGSGKSRTALAYYFTQQGGKLSKDEYIPMGDPPKDLYIITTAKKRDSLEWEDELGVFLMTRNKELSMYDHNIVVDSWNNIGKYKDVSNAFFIFDEQRIVGGGAWVKAFLKISKSNHWILLSATPGDNWSDYIPVFVANGFFKNRSEFQREHIIYKRFSKFPQIDRYIGTKRLERMRERILVDMPFERETVAHHEIIMVEHDRILYKDLQKNRWNVYENKPIVNVAELCYLLRKLVNSDESRQIELLKIVEKNPRVIVFYNFDYELEILKSLYYGPDVTVAEWNGHKHQDVPKTEKWVYLVQYTAGAEGWNCTTTDTMVFFSQTYSYKILHQSTGRIDRMNTPFKDLYYYHFKSRATIDLAIARVLKDKKKFNERSFYNKLYKE
jgi:hypothetical protein